MKRTLCTLMLCAMISVVGVFIVSCVSDDENISIKTPQYTKEQYEEMFKKRLIMGLNDKSVAPNFFIDKLGYPVWGNLKWSKGENGKDIVSVPLVCVSKYTRVAIGIVGKYGLDMYVAEVKAKALQTRSASPEKMKVYDLQYLNGIGGLRTRSTEGEIAQMLSREDSHGARELYSTLEGNGSYDEDMTFGDIYIQTTDSDIIDYRLSRAGTEDDSSIAGHAWIRIKAWYGAYDGSTEAEEATTSIFGSFFSSSFGGSGLGVNEDLDNSISASKSESITYGGFQKILDFNSDSDNVDYDLLSNNCVHYSVAVWNMVTGNNINLGTVTWTPHRLRDYLNGF